MLVSHNIPGLLMYIKAKKSYLLIKFILFSLLPIKHSNSGGPVTCSYTSVTFFLICSFTR